MDMIIENENIKINLYSWAGKFDIRTIQIKKFSNVDMGREDLNRILDCIIEKHTTNKLIDYINYNKHNQKVLTGDVIDDFIRDYEVRDLSKLSFVDHKKDKDYRIDFDKEIISFRGLKFDLNTLHCNFENFKLYNFSENTLSSYIVHQLINDNRFDDNIYIKLTKELMRFIEFTKGKKTVAMKLKGFPIKKTDDFNRVNFVNTCINISANSIEDIEYMSYNKTEFRFNQEIIKDALEALKKEVYK